MVSQQEGIFRISRKRLYLLWFLLLVILAILGGLPIWLAISGWPYPNLDLLLFFFAMIPMMWIAVLLDFGPRTALIELRENGFAVKKIAQKVSWHSYSDILTHNERPNSSIFESFTELRVYLSNNWFLIRSNDFKDYNYLKARFTQYGQVGSRQNGLTRTERNRFRWAIGGFALLITANIVFGYVAHNPVAKKPARLTPITGIVDHVSKNMSKGMLKGFTFRLRNWPDFDFDISRKSYALDIHALNQAILLNEPITLLIRESDYRKKLVKTLPLTFGDKYGNYQQIWVFGINQGHWIRIQTTEPVYEPAHTNPTQRAILLGFLLLLCWAGWVYIDRYKVLQAD